MTFIDWHTLKIIGEAADKSIGYFLCQYIYYLFEVALVLCILMFGQKAFDLLIKRESHIPFGGLVLAFT